MHISLLADILKLLGKFFFQILKFKIISSKMAMREALDNEYVNYPVKFSDRCKLTKTSSILDNLNVQVYEVSFHEYNLKMCTLWKSLKLLLMCFSNKTSGVIGATHIQY